MTQTIIDIQGVSKRFDDHQALDNINLSVENGEFLTLLGPSGCGKTSLLRLLSGFDRPDQGQIFINGEDVTQQPPETRHVNMVFQNYALFPHMTVYDNVAFGLRCKKIANHLIQQQVMQTLEVVGLESLSNRKPHQLSGGQQQRVAIARAVVNHPLVLLLDEPLSALDYKLRKQMQIELKKLQRKLGITFILVTHDQEEALSMSDRVVVMNHGHIEQIGSPRDIYEKPNSLYVANFIGETNIFECTVKHAEDNKINVDIIDKAFTFDCKKNFEQGQAISIIVRPEDIRVWDQTEVKDTHDMLPGTVDSVVYKGSTVDLIVRLSNGKQISATEFFDEDDENLEYTMGEKVWLHWPNGWEIILPHE